MKTRRLSTNWASSDRASSDRLTSGNGIQHTPPIGVGMGRLAMSRFSFKRSDRFSSRKARRNLSGCHGGPGRAQFGNRKTPRRTGTFDWLRIRIPRRWRWPQKNLAPVDGRSSLVVSEQVSERPTTRDQRPDLDWPTITLLHRSFAGTSERPTTSDYRRAFWRTWA